MDMNMKWNDYPSDVLFLWDGETLFRIAEGSGDNLFDEDIEEGYVDYWLTDYYNFNDGNGGQWLETKYIRDIDYTIQGVLDRLKECDLWDSDWKIIDEDTGYAIMKDFEDYYEHWRKARYHNEEAEEIKNKIKKSYMKG